MSNNYEATISEIDKIEDEIFELNQTIAPKVNALQNKKFELKTKLDLEIAKQAAEDLKEKDYGCGTATIDTPRHKIKVVVSKKIKWDEKALREVANQINDAGQDPEDFIKYKLSVSETAYKSFTPEIQKTFEAAREITPSAPKITIERK